MRSRPCWPKRRCSRTALPARGSTAATRPAWCGRPCISPRPIPICAIWWTALCVPDPELRAGSKRPFESLPPLDGVQEARVAIVGGGYAGVCLALGLAERGMRDVVLLEREGIGHGASGRNGGFVFAGYSLGEDELLRQLGAERARVLYGTTTHAVDLIRRRIRQYAIACDAV